MQGRARTKSLERKSAPGAPRQARSQNVVPEAWAEAAVVVGSRRALGVALGHCLAGGIVLRVVARRQPTRRRAAADHTLHTTRTETTATYQWVGLPCKRGRCNAATARYLDRHQR
jgi:hypothetical protein